MGCYFTISTNWGWERVSGGWGEGVSMTTGGRVLWRRFVGFPANYASQMYWVTQPFYTIQSVHLFMRRRYTPRAQNARQNIFTAVLWEGLGRVPFIRISGQPQRG